MGGWGLLMSMVFVLFWVLVALGIVALLVLLRRRQGRSFGAQPGPYAPPHWQPGPGPGPGPGAWAGSGLTPEQILADRFARGEIDEKEYRQRMAALRAEGGTAGSAGTAGPGSSPGAGAAGPADQD